MEGMLAVEHTWPAGCRTGKFDGGFDRFRS